MKLKQSTLYLFLLLFLLFIDSVIFYLVWGLGVLLYAGILIFTAGILVLIYHFSRTGLPAAGRGLSLEKQNPEKNLQTGDTGGLPDGEPVFQDFTLHKRIIFIELCIIVFLLILLFIRKGM